MIAGKTLRAISCAAGLLLTGEAGFAMSCASADSMKGLLTRWAKLADDAQRGGAPEIRSETALSADGFALLLSGEVDCVAYVREPFAAEIAAYGARFGRAPLLVAIAGGSYATRGGTHAIAIYVQQDNPLDRLTMAQLEGIFSGRITEWGQLGLGGDFAGKRITLYGMLRRRESGNPPGIVNFMQIRVLAGRAIREDSVEVIDRPGETALSGIVRHVAEDRFGIGYSGFGFARQGAKTVKIAETEQGPYYEGSEEQVAKRLYPLSRTVYLMFRPGADGGLTAEQKAFLRVVLSPQGQRALGEDATQFLPLTEEQLERSRASLSE